MNGIRNVLFWLAKEIGRQLLQTSYHVLPNGIGMYIFKRRHDAHLGKACHNKRELVVMYL